MKFLSISSAALVLLLSGCAAQSGDHAAASEQAYEQGEYKVGSLFPQKHKQRVVADADSTANSAANSATMNVETMQSR